jgi:DNA-binding protein HU-beta
VENRWVWFDLSANVPVHFTRTWGIAPLVFFVSYSLLGENIKVNKNDLAAVVAGKSGLSKADAAKAVEAVLDGIVESLQGGTEVRLVGFGTFSVSRRNASQGRNPRTGQAITIPAANVPKFKAGKALKEALN